MRAMTGYGLRQTEVATVIGISKPTLAKHYREELDQGMIQANAKVTESLYNNAVKRHNVTAQIFWLKNRSPDLWRDRHDVEHSGETIQRIRVEFVEAKPSNGAWDFEGTSPGDLPAIN